MLDKTFTATLETPDGRITDVTEAVHRMNNAGNGDMFKGQNLGHASEHKRGFEGPAGVTADQLKQFIERIERLEEEKQTIADDIKDVYAEAKSTGYDTKIMKQVIKIRKQDKAEREEQEALLDLYLSALGMIFVARDEEE